MLRQAQEQSNLQTENPFATPYNTDGASQRNFAI
jgi:hypothetical protein